jgi:hypothetical protein
LALDAPPGILSASCCSGFIRTKFEQRFATAWEFDVAFLGAPEIPKGLKGVNLALAFMVSVAFVAATNLLASTSETYSAAISRLPAWAQVAAALGTTLLAGIALYRIITKAITAAQLVAIKQARSAGTEEEEEEEEDNVSSKGELSVLLFDLKSSSNAQLREFATIIEAESSTVEHDFARHCFPVTTARLYTKLILTGGGFTVFAIACNIGSLRRVLFDPVPGNSGLVAPLDVLVILPVALLLVLFLSAVAHRRSRYKEWRLPRWSLLVIRHNMCGVIEEVVSRIDGIVMTLNSLAGAEKKRVPRKYRRVHSEWEPVHDRLLFSVLPIGGELIDLPKGLQQLYDHSCKELHAGIRNIARAEFLRKPPPQDVGGTAIDNAVNDLTNARERITRIGQLLRAYNSLVRPYVSIP